MNRNSNTYTVAYATALTVLVAVGLSLAALGLKPQQTRNSDNEKKQQVLAALGPVLAARGQTVTFDNAAALWDEYHMDDHLFAIAPSGERLADVDAFALVPKKQFAKGHVRPDAQLPVYEAHIDGSTYYILALYGSGLWGDIWGYLAVMADGNTIAGAAFDHASETAGLGAKIKDDPAWAAQFAGRHLFSDSTFTSVAVVKKGKTVATDYVDAITGATLTSVGVADMIRHSVTGYEAFLRTVQSENKQ